MSGELEKYLVRMEPHVRRQAEDALKRFQRPGGSKEMRIAAFRTLQAAFFTVNAILLP